MEVSPQSTLRLPARAAEQDLAALQRSAAANRTAVGAETEILHAINQLLMADRAAAETLSEFLETLSRALGLESASIWLRESGDERIRCEAAWGAERLEDFLAETRTMSLAAGRGDEAWERFQERRAAECGRAGLRSAWFFPLPGRETIPGLLEVCRQTPLQLSAGEEAALRQAARATGFCLERTRNLAALVSSEAQYRMMFENILTGVFRTSPDGLVLAANPALLRMLGFDELSEDAKRAIERNGFGEDLPAETFRELFEGSGEIRGLEAEWARSSGEVLCVRENIKAVRASDGNLLFYEGSVEDITERRRAEEKLKRYMHELEATRETLQRQSVELAATRDRALEASRIKSEFLANVSHELRTPMNGIIGLTELVLVNPLSAEQLEYLEMIKSSADSLLGLLNDLLDFSRMEAGKLALVPVPFDLRKHLDDVVKPMRFRAGAKGLRFVHDVDAGVPENVIGDPDRLRQVLINLAGNAIKFTHEGSVRLRVRLVSAINRRAVLRFTVRDTGIGIPAESQTVIFQPFTQADGSTTRKYGGSGLGLSISTQLVEMMGGTITVESQPGEGSTFEFSAPFLLPADEPEPARDKKAERPGPPAMPSCDILLAEDNLVSQRLVTRMLEKQGHRVTVASNGREAVETAERRAFDLIFMDVQMPEMDGLQATAALRRLGVRTPVVALTARAMTGDRERCLDAGMNTYLSKPVRMGEIEAAVRLWAGRRENG
jgi:PAS domain S-box-containing protein